MQSTTTSQTASLLNQERRHILMDFGDVLPWLTTGSLTTVIGPSSSGKTAVGLTIANATAAAGLSCAFVSRPGVQGDLLERLAHSRANVPIAPPGAQQQLDEEAKRRLSEETQAVHSRLRFVWRLLGDGPQVMQGETIQVTLRKLMGKQSEGEDHGVGEKPSVIVIDSYGQELLAQPGLTPAYLRDFARTHDVAIVLLVSTTGHTRRLFDVTGVVSGPFRAPTKAVCFEHEGVMDDADVVLSLLPTSDGMQMHLVKSPPSSLPSRPRYQPVILDSGQLLQAPDLEAAYALKQLPRVARLTSQNRDSASPRQ